MQKQHAPAGDPPCAPGPVAGGDPGRRVTRRATRSRAARRPRPGTRRSRERNVRNQKSDDGCWETGGGRGWRRFAWKRSADWPSAVPPPIGGRQPGRMAACATGSSAGCRRRGPGRPCHPGRKRPHLKRRRAVGPRCGAAVERRRRSGALPVRSEKRGGRSQKGMPDAGCRISNTESGRRSRHARTGGSVAQTSGLLFRGFPTR
jgi:hypothetical protein